ncbi:uroporphyrinogen-III C-methyltransferase [Maribacter confluentis]
MEVEKEAIISLVGAGPGAKDLITLRGMKVLQSADVILYDALVSNDLLQELRSDIPKIYIGKRCGKHSHTQEEINELLVAYALQYGHVVRLKGGDPFVFGRANEEIAYAEAFGISVYVVPGISSSLAVPTGQGIPMTKRGVSSSFWVMTATMKDGSFSKDLEYASRSSTTMVVLMGIKKLVQIVDEVNQYRGSLTPIAVIQNGTLGNEQCIVATLGTIKDYVGRISIDMPGIIVIGDVVAEHPAFFEEEVQRVLYSGY